jgi:hypothetical protein
MRTSKEKKKTKENEDFKMEEKQRDNKGTTWNIGRLPEL